MRRIAIVYASVLLIASVAPAAVTVTAIDGRSHAGRLAELSDAGAKVVGKGKKVTVAAEDLLGLRFPAVPADPWAKRGQAIVRLHNGGLIPAEDVAVADGSVTGRSEVLGRFRVGAFDVRRLVLPNPRTTGREVLQATAGLFDQADGDILAVRSAPGEYVAAAGVLGKLGQEKIAFRYGDADRTIDRAKVVAIQLAEVACKMRIVRGEVIGIDGLRLPFTSAALAGDRIRLAGTAVGDVDVPVEAVAEICYRTGRVAYLDELTPAAVRETGVFGHSFTWRRNRSTAGGPLKLDGRSYERGVSLHSRCELTYKLDGAYETLVATAGIDDAARPRGSAILSFTADAEPLGKPITLRGSLAEGEKIPAQLAQPIRLDVRGVKTLTILVDFGDDLDVGDHVDLADAKLIREQG